MNDTPPNGSPNLDDPEWVDKILARARERAAEPEPAVIAPIVRPAATASWYIDDAVSPLRIVPAGNVTYGEL